MPTNSRPSWSVADSPSRAVTRCRMRSLSSAAAFSVNVKATIDSARLAVGEQRRDPLRDDLGLARAGRGDDLHVPAAVRDRGSGLALEDRGRVRSLLRHATKGMRPDRDAASDLHRSRIGCCDRERVRRR